MIKRLLIRLCSWYLSRVRCVEIGQLSTVQIYGMKGYFGVTSTSTTRDYDGKHRATFTFQELRNRKL